MNNSHFKVLLEHYLNNSLSQEEMRELLGYLRLDENHDQLLQTIEQSLSDNTFAGLSDKSKTDLLFESIMQKAIEIEGVQTLENKVYHISPKKNLFTLPRVAAAILILISAGTYLFLNNKPAKDIAQSKSISRPLKTDISPGGNKAVLTLADGTAIILDSAQNGIISQQGNTKVLKLNSGQLAYNTLNNTPAEVLYNTISTPRGGQYQVVLQDGSKVWLNAASSLRFPTAFTGKERTVQLTGEAYFEVAKNAAMPFKVQVNKMEVSVLGTHFNVMAYDDESSIKTTLLEGSVRVTKENANALLKPGQEAILNPVEEGFKVDDADVDEAVAWKNGLFQFNSTGLKSIMRQISRWYNVEVSYEGDVSGKNFSGLILRNTNLSEVLKMLQLTREVQFKVEGKKITVLP
jgi:transmembrane sensor